MGERHGKIVVACKDFAVEDDLIEIRTIKNYADSELAELLEQKFTPSDSEHTVDIEELILHLANNPILNKLPGITERFWEQAVIDIFINNNNRIMVTGVSCETGKGKADWLQYLIITRRKYMTKNLRMATTVILVLAMTFICYACGKKQGNPIRLPDRNEVVSIGVLDGEKLAFSPNTEGEADAFIDEFYSLLLDMEVTSKESINDVPVNKDFITININCLDNSVTTLFYYKDKGTEYVEQPYQGIYKPAPALGICITEMLNSSDSTIGQTQQVVEETQPVEENTMNDRIPMVICMKLMIRY